MVNSLYLHRMLTVYYVQTVCYRRPAAAATAAAATPGILSELMNTDRAIAFIANGPIASCRPLHAAVCP